MFMNRNPYKNSFQLTLKFHRVVDVIVLLVHFAQFAFLLCQTFFPKNPLFKSVFEKSFLPSDRTRFCLSFHGKTKQNQKTKTKTKTKNKTKCHTHCVFTLWGRSAQL